MLFSDVLNPVSPTSNSGFCIISDVEGPPGIVSLLRDDSLNILYAIPPEFDDLEVYFATSRHLRSPQTLPVMLATLVHLTPAPIQSLSLCPAALLCYSAIF